MKLILDTETTGLDPNKNAILQVSMIDDHNRVLFNKYIKPSQEHFTNTDLLRDWLSASSLNGLYIKNVENEKELPVYRDDIASLLNSADELVGYNPSFDINFLRANGINLNSNIHVTDVLTMFSNFYKAKAGNKYKRKNLIFAFQFFGGTKKYLKEAHNSLADCFATLYVYNKLNSVNKNPILKAYYKLKAYVVRALEKRRERIESEA